MLDPIKISYKLTFYVCVTYLEYNNTLWILLTIVWSWIVFNLIMNALKTFKVLELKSQPWKHFARKTLGWRKVVGLMANKCYEVSKKLLDIWDMTDRKLKTISCFTCSDKGSSLLYQFWFYFVPFSYNGIYFLWFIFNRPLSIWESALIFKCSDIFF